MSGFLNRIAARGMGQAGSVHSAARLPFAAAPALLETAGEAMAPPPSMGSLSHGGPTREPAPAPMSTARDAAPGEIARTDPKPAPLLPRPAMPAPAAVDDAAQDQRNAPGDAADVEADRAQRRAANKPLLGVPEPIMPVAVHGAQEMPARDDDGPAPLRRIQPLLPPQRGPNATASFKAAPGSAWRRPVEETTEVHVSIGRIEVMAVHEAPPLPKRAAARGQRALSLEDYLARRKAGRP